MTDEEITLTPKQEKFVLEYLVDLNSTQAAIRAGYSPNSAKQIGCENLTKHDIQVEIQRKRDEISKKTILTIEQLDEDIRFMAEAAKQDPLFNDKGLEVGTRVNYAGLGKALELHGKRIQAYQERIDLTNSDKNLKPTIYIPDNNRDGDDEDTD